MEVKRSSTGRTIHPRHFYQDEYQEICANRATNYYDVLDDSNNDNEEIYGNEMIGDEIANVGTGIGGSFKHSSELKVLNYK